MRVTKLSATNFKGRAFVHDLAPVTLFYGRNFAGKSARLEAFVLSLAGYLPGVGKAPRDLFDRLASGNPMAVQTQFDDGTSVVRQWEEKRGSVKCDEPVGVVLPAVAADAGEFLNLSSTNRVKLLFNRATLPEELSVDALQKSVVANLKNLKLEVNTPATEQVIADLTTRIYEPDLTGAVQSWVEELVQDMKEKKLAADQTVKRMASTSQGLAQVARQDPAPQDAEERWKRASDAFQTAERERLRMEDELGCESDPAAHRPPAGLLGTIETLERVKGKRPASTVDGLVDLVQRRAELMVSPPPDPGPKAPLSEAWKTANAAHKKAVEEQTELSRRIDALKQQAASLAGEKDCGHCGQKLKGAALARVKKKAEDVKAELERLGKLLYEATVLTGHTKKVLDDITAGGEKWAAKDQARRAWQAELDKLNAAELAHHKASDEAKAAAEASAKLPGLIEDARLLREKLDNQRGVCAKLKQNMDAAYADTRKLLAERADAAAGARALEERQKAEAEAAVLKELCAMLSALQAKLVDETVGPLLAKANALCAPVLRSRLSYKDGEIGMDPGTGFVSWRTFSGTERALAFCALSVALAADAPMKVVVLDELGRLDSFNQGKVLELLCELQSRGSIDQAVVALAEAVATENFPVRDNFEAIRV